MNILKILALIFVSALTTRTYQRFRDKSLSILNFVFWIIIWLLLLIFVFDPALSDVVAKIAGLGRGVDAMFLFAIILLFLLMFKIYIKIDTIDKHLTSLTINTSKTIHDIKKEQRQ